MAAMKNIVVPILILGAMTAGDARAAAFDANGVKLGESERAVKRAFPTAHCKPLEWNTPAADRRCDDVKAVFGGAPARITLYLRKDALQGFDVRFDTREADKVAAFLKKRYGKPAAEAREPSAKDGKEIYKVLWEDGKDRAALVAQADKRRAQVTVSRGNFEEEVYKVR
jgi:hypothetical protein